VEYCIYSRTSDRLHNTPRVLHLVGRLQELNIVDIEEGAAHILSNKLCNLSSQHVTYRNSPVKFKNKVDSNLNATSKNISHAGRGRMGYDVSM
jgi:hypothetical protein